MNNKISVYDKDTFRAYQRLQIQFISMKLSKSPTCFHIVTNLKGKNTDLAVVMEAFTTLFRTSKVIESSEKCQNKLKRSQQWIIFSVFPYHFYQWKIIELPKVTLMINTFAFIILKNFPLLSIIHD